MEAEAARLGDRAQRIGHRREAGGCTSCIIQLTHSA
jgi:hypothetical protein